MAPPAPIAMWEASSAPSIPWRRHAHTRAHFVEPSWNHDPQLLAGPSILRRRLMGNQ